MKNNKSSDNFSVALGLTDYINPIMYLITSITLILNLNKIMTLPYSIFYILIMKKAYCFFVHINSFSF